MSKYYVLDGHEPIPVDSLEEWARFFEGNARYVDEQVIGDVRISTVFLGLDHAHFGGEPLLFETMIFGGPHDQYQTRCSTWDQAVAQHAEAVALVRQTLQ